MWSWLSMMSTVLAGILGTFATFTKAPTSKRYKGWTLAGLLLITSASAVFAWLDNRQDQRETEEYERQTLGKGGYPTVVVQGLMPIDGQIVNGRVLAQIMIFNESNVPVFDSRVQVSQFVGIPNGFMQSDHIFFPWFSVSTINPHDMPHSEYQDYLLKLDQPNIFSAVVFSKWATFSEQIVAVWKDGAWQTDTEVRLVKEPARGNDDTLLRPMRDDLRKLLPGATKK